MLREIRFLGLLKKSIDLIPDFVLIVVSKSGIFDPLPPTLSSFY